MSITIADITFDQARYDAEGDVLYLHHNSPAAAVDFDASAEGHALRFDPRGDLVGVTVLNAAWLLEHEGAITLTLPSADQPTRLTDGQLHGVLSAPPQPYSDAHPRRKLSQP